MLIFLLSVPFVSDAIFAPGGANVVRCAAHFWRLAYIRSALKWWTNSLKGLPSHQVRGQDWCRTEEVAPSFSRLHQQALSAANGGCASSGVGHSFLSVKRNTESSHLCSWGLSGFSLSRYMLLDSMPLLQYKHNHGLLLFKVEISWPLPKLVRGRPWVIWLQLSSTSRNTTITQGWVPQYWCWHPQGSWQPRYKLKL